jgi:hypothetical protein
MTCKYNGWKNYETWVVMLSIDNERAAYRYWRDAARETLRDAEPTPPLTRRESAHVGLAARLKDEIDEDAPCPEDWLYAALLKAALEEVDWHEIAASLLDDVAPDEATEPIG